MFDETILKKIYFGNSLRDWLIVGVFIVLAPIVPKLLKYLFAKLMGGVDHMDNRDLETFRRVLNSIIDATKTGLISLLVIIMSLNILELSAKTDKALHNIFIILLMLQIGIWAWSIIDIVVDRILKTDEQHVQTKSLQSSHAIILFIIRVVVVATLLLTMFDHMGFQVRTIVAGLGVGGIAVALAVQNVLGDVLSSLAIALDKPFEIGDRISVDQWEGYVETIGIKTTRLRSISGEQLIISNSDLLRSKIRNFKRQVEKKDSVKFTLSSLTKVEQIKSLQEILFEKIHAMPDIRADKIVLTQINQLGIEVEIGYTLSNNAFSKNDEYRQNINFSVLEACGSLKIAFAAPPPPAAPAIPAG